MVYFLMWKDTSARTPTQASSFLEEKRKLAKWDSTFRSLPADGKRLVER